MSRPRSICSFLFAGCLGLLAGCANPSSPNAIMDRIDAHRDEYETWPFPIKDAVMSGQVLKGMDTTMVLVARGSPAERIDRGNGDEIWVYHVRSEDPSSSGGGGGSILPHGTTISVGGGNPVYSGSPYPSTYPGSMYPGSTYPGSTYPGGGIGVALPPIVLGGGSGNSESTEDEEQVVFRNGRVTLGDKVK